MRFKKNTVNSLLVISLLIIGSIVFFRVSYEAKLAKFISDRNIICGDLSVNLDGQEGIDDCYCYFDGSRTGLADVDNSTEPLCVCECLINGTMYRIPLVSPKV